MTPTVNTVSPKGSVRFVLTSKGKGQKGPWTFSKLLTLGGTVHQTYTPAYSVLKIKKFRSKSDNGEETKTDRKLRQNVKQAAPS